MNDLALMSNSASSVWRKEFANTLIRLRPDLNPDAADELSDAAFMCLANLDPRQAAAQHCRSGNQAARSAADAQTRTDRRAMSGA